MNTAAPTPLARALLAIALAPFCAGTAFAVSNTTTINTYNGSLATNGLTNGANWSEGVPTSVSGAGAYAHMLFTTAESGSLFTGTGGSTNFNAASYNITNGASYTLQINATTAAIFRVGSTSNTGTGEVILAFTNSVSDVAQDLIYLSNGSDLTFNATNTAGGAATVFQVRQAGNYNIGAGSVLTFNTAISGNHAITITGAGTTILNAGTSSTAATNINGGTLRYGVNDALGTGAVNIGGGTLDLQTYNDAVGAVTLSSGSITGSGTLTGTSYAVTGTGSITANLAGTGGLTITSDGGTLTLGGSNTYSGVTFANYSTGGGSIIATTTTALSANSEYRTASSSANAGTLNLAAAGSHTMASLNLGSTLETVGPESGSASITFTNGGFQSGSTGKILRAGENAAIIFGDTVGASHFDLVGSTATADRNLTVSGAGNTIFNSILRDNASGAAASYKGGLVVNGTGTVTLNAANTYTGATSVSSGALIVNGSTAAASAVTVSGTGRLGGSGTIGGAVTIGAASFLTPGNSPGTLTLENGLTLNGTYVWEIDANSASTGFDVVRVTAGDITLGSGSVFEIAPLSGVDFTNAFWSADQSWTVLDNTGEGTLTGTFLGGLTGVVSNAYGTFSLEYGAGPGGDVILHWTSAGIIPEPSSAALLAGLGILGFAASRRTRRAD